MKLKFSNILFALFIPLFAGITMQVAAEGDSESALTTEKSPTSWLMRMQEAAMTTNYRGTFVFSRGSMPSTVKIVHRFKDGIEEERLTQLDGQMGEIIRKGTEVMCVLPDNRIVKTEKPAFASGIVESFADFDPSNGMYKVEVHGYERLINRETVKIGIKALDKNRYSYYLWQDKHTGLLLKSSMRNHEDEELERFQFSQLTFVDHIPDSVFRPLPEGEVESHTMIPMVSKDYAWPGGMNWSVKWMPDGFEPLNPKDKAGQNVLVYSDGLASFSVFVEQVQSNSMPEGAALAGGTVAYFHKVVTGKHHYGVTVMGEIPPMTAMMVAESVVPSMPAQ